MGIFGAIAEMRIAILEGRIEYGQKVADGINRYWYSGIRYYE